MKYWVYMNAEVPGSYEPEELARIAGFSAASMVCPAGGPLESRNWQQAGLYPEIVGALEAGKAAAAAPRPPEPPPRDFVDPAAAAASPEDILGAASHRLFRHVAELMKELENRREERALTQSLQRGLVEVKNELQAARERIRFLDDRVSLIPGFEDRERVLQKLLEKAREDLRARDETGAEFERRIQAGESKAREAEAARDNALRLQDEAVRDKRLYVQNAGELNRQLAQKELTLAKALAVIRRLEDELGNILPQAASGISSEVPRPYDDRPQEAAAPPASEPAPEPIAAAPEAQAQPEPILEPEVLRPPDAGLLAAADALDSPPVRPEVQPPAPEGGPTAPPAGFKTLPPPWKAALDDAAAFFKREKRKAKDGEPQPPAAGNA